MTMPAIPKGSGAHPISLIVISANTLDASQAFYSKLFGWKFQPLSKELIAFTTSGGPAGALRSNVPEGFPGVVPYIAVDDVEAKLKQVESLGGSIEKAPWKMPMMGQLARFNDPSCTIYGLTDMKMPVPMGHIPMPLGTNSKPPAGSLCSLEMYAKDGELAAKFFGELFQWGMMATMPQYMAFDPGAGLGGVFQSHTPTLPVVAYIYVEDVPGKIAEIEAAGRQRQGDPMEMPGMGFFGYFLDPSKTCMGLIGPCKGS